MKPLGTLLLLALVSAIGPFQARAAGPLPGGFEVYTDSTLATPGLVGSYVNANLRNYAPHDDWRLTQVISGTRVDSSLDFPGSSWGVRATVGLTGGTDSDWDLFSVQWDGVVRILAEDSRLATLSDDSSRMWIDLDLDGQFEPISPEFIDNHWGTPQAATLGDLSVALPVGVYPIRIQYEEEYFGNIFKLVDVPLPTLRVAYAIPSNRTPQVDGTTRLQYWVRMLEWYFCEQLDRLGVGSRTFRYETEADGVTPRIHLLSLAEPDIYFHQDTWGRVGPSATAAGATLWSPGEVWLIVPEIHIQLPSGVVIGGVALGGGFGSGSGAGVAMVGSPSLALAAPEALFDDTDYDGLVVPAVGPYPLVFGASFPGFEGTTISSVVSSYIGAMGHELGHAFGLPHDFRNDNNFHGNLMGNGLRGFRGAAYPDRYTADDCRTSYSTALALSVSQYFRECQGLVSPAVPATPGPVPQPLQGSTGTGSPGTAAGPPIPLTCGTQPTGAGPLGPGGLLVTLLSSTTAGGQFEVHFEASSPAGLASAHLGRNGDRIAELELAGTSAAGTLRTPYYAPGVTDNFAVAVYDQAGNRAQVSVPLTPAAVANRAPQPFFRISRSQPAASEMATLDAGQTADPESSAWSVQWDLDADGVYDTQTSASPVFGHVFGPGTHRVRMRVVDAGGAAAESTIIAVRVQAPGGGAEFVRGDCNGDGGMNIADAVAALLYLFSAGGIPACVDACDANDSGSVDLADPIYLLGSLFTGSAAPLPPHPACGLDPGPDALSCLSYPGCP